MCTRKYFIGKKNEEINPLTSTNLASIHEVNKRNGMLNCYGQKRRNEKQFS